MDNNSNYSNPFNFDSSVYSPKQEHLPSQNPLDALMKKVEEPPQEDPVQQYLKKITAEKDPFDLATERVPAQDFQNFYSNAGKKYSQIDHLANDVDPFKKEEPLPPKEEPKPEIKVQKEVEIQTIKEEPKIEEVVDEQEEQPNYPQFEDKLKQIRETYAKDYEEKINRGFEEIDEIKKYIASKQQLHETQ